MPARLTALALIAATLLPLRAEATDLFVERGTEHVCRGAACDGPVYLSRMLERCEVRTVREYRNDRFILRRASFCPGTPVRPIVQFGRLYLYLP